MKKFKEKLIYVTALFLGFLAAIYLKLVKFTSKIEYIESDYIKNRPEKESVIFSIWHGRLLGLSLYRHRMRNPILIITDSIIAVILTPMAWLHKTKTAERPKDLSRKAVEAMMPVMNNLRKNEGDVLITPDGSAGPRMRINEGLCKMSKSTKSKVIPLSFSCKRAIFLNSWDVFCIPLPFNVITVRSGDPIDPTDYKIEEIRYLVEKEQNKILHSLDEIYDQHKVYPSSQSKSISAKKIVFYQHDDYINPHKEKDE